MTHPNNPTNGASLEDCHTNFFALTDLCGIKWRRLSTDPLLLSPGGQQHQQPQTYQTPLDDPVLSSYSKCLASDILCDWRRTQAPKAPPPPTPITPMPPTPTHPHMQHMMHPMEMPQQHPMMHHPHQQHPHLTPHMHPHGPGPGGGIPPQMQHPHQQQHTHQQHPSLQHTPLTQHQISTLWQGNKELWIFWYGEEPDLGGLVAPELLVYEGEQGSWESGLSYECRSILFNALHNLIERCMLSRDFIRLGKWFVNPYDVMEKISGKSSLHLSFSFTFFVHGESTVCVSLDVREHPPVRKLSRQHILAAQTSSVGIQVILGPYGLAGTFTGQTFKGTDYLTKKMLEEWHNFYPVDYKSISREGSGDPSMPAAVEVVVGGVRMRYPTCYALVSDMDNTTNFAISPNQMLNEDSNSNNKSISNALLSSQIQLPPVGIPENTKIMSSKLPERMWQDSTLPPSGLSISITTDGGSSVRSVGDGPTTPLCGSMDRDGHWDFVDPIRKMSCSCSKCKRPRHGKLSVLSKAASKGVIGGTPGSGRYNGRGITPFHRRSPLLNVDDGDDTSNNGRLTAPDTPSGAPSYRGGSQVLTPTPLLSAHGSNTNVGERTVDSLPAVPSVDSPASVAPSPLPTPHSQQPTSVPPQTDPTMPTLSPHPPASNDTGPLQPSTPMESQDMKVTPAATPNTAESNNGPKSVSSVTNQAYSPYPSRDGGPPSVSKQHGDPMVWLNTPSLTCLPLNNNRDIQQNTGSNNSGIKRRPHLPSKEYEGLLREEEEEASDALYDYGSLRQWLHYSVKRFKPNESLSLPTSMQPKRHHGDLYSSNSLSHTIASYSSSVSITTVEVKQEISITPVYPSSCHQLSCGGRDSLEPSLSIIGGKRPADPYEFDDDATNSPSVAGMLEGDIKKENSPFDAVAASGTKGPTGSLYTIEGLQPSFKDLEQIFDNSDDTSSGDDAFQASTPPGSNKPSGQPDDSTSMTTTTNSKTSSKNTITNTTGPPGILRPEELSKMFPTPPSHEPNPIASPLPLQVENQATPEYSGENNNNSLREGSSNNTFPPSGGKIKLEGGGYLLLGSPQQEEIEDWSFVFRPPIMCKLVGSSKYAPLTNLPSQSLPPCTLPSGTIYKPSWQYNNNNPEKQNITLTSTSHLSSALSGNIPPNISTSNLQLLPILSNAMSHHMSHPHHTLPPHHPQHSNMMSQNVQPLRPPPMPFGGEHGPMTQHPRGMMAGIPPPHPMHPHGGPPPPHLMQMHHGIPPHNMMVPPHHMQPYDMPSPHHPSGPVPPYHMTNPNHKAIVDHHNTSHVSKIPETSSLIVNLLLSDSMLNIFKDHNFDSCTLCVCNAGPKLVGNIRGADAGLYLPDSGSQDEDPLRCNCGFSAVVNRRLAYQSGLFYEDEVEITGLMEEPSDRKKSLATLLDIKGNDNDALVLDLMPQGVLELVRDMCLVLHSSASTLSCVSQVYRSSIAERTVNALEFMDGNEIGCAALEISQTSNSESMHNQITTYHPPHMKLDDSKSPSSCLHKWPFILARGAPCNEDIVRVMKGLQPLLQDAVQRKCTTRLWEAPYTVSGPLTWRQFHRLAGRGTEDRCEAQPVPTLLVGYDKDWLAVSPFTMKYWQNLLLEPYSYARDVAYIIVAPDNEHVLSNVRTFFKELSVMYEVCRLGRHCPITKVLRDGILRVGRSAATKLANEPVDEWFSLLGDSNNASMLKLYAQVCRHHLAPHLSSMPLDRTLLDCPGTSQQGGAGLRFERPSPSPMPPPSTPDNTSTQDKAPSTPKSDSAESTDPSSRDNGCGSSIGSDGLDYDGEEREPPAIVIYLVDPFSYGTDNSDVNRLAALGLLRCYLHMLSFLPETVRTNISLQIISLESVLRLGQCWEGSRHSFHMRDLAMSVFMQSRRPLHHATAMVKSLTGFGPAAAADLFLRSKDDKNRISYRLHAPAFVLSPLKEKLSDLGESFSTTREQCSVLYCSYCLSADQRWLLASCTDDRGEVLEICPISIDIPNRSRRKKASARRIGLQKLMDFILGIMSMGVHPWRLVVGRVGRIGHGELKGWSTLLSRKSLTRASKQLKELCAQCQLLPSEIPCILSACLVSLEPDSALRMMPDQCTPDERFGQTSCNLSTPQDVSCTHILVFPTSATTQSSQTAFQEQHINGPDLGDDDLLSALNDDMPEGIDGMQDFNDIFSNWPETGPGVPSPVGSPRRDSVSQPGSPNDIMMGGGMGGRQSPFQMNGQGRTGGSLAADSQEDVGALLQQPLALGYLVSTATTGTLPPWFWAACPHLQGVCPAFLKSALHLHSPQQSSDDLLQQHSQLKVHPLDSTYTTDVLRYVLEGYNALSWLALDPITQDRKSCLPIHVQLLMQFYDIFGSLI